MYEQQQGTGHNLQRQIRVLIYKQYTELHKDASQIYQDCFVSMNPIVSKGRIRDILRMFADSSRQEETKKYLEASETRGGNSRILDDSAMMYLRRIVLSNKSARIAKFTRLLGEEYYGDVDKGPSQSTVWRSIRILGFTRKNMIRQNINASPTAVVEKCKTLILVDW